MQETYLSIPKEIWDGIFMFLRYGVTAFIIAYLTSVYVKQKKNIIDLKGEMLERRIDSYKEIHRWAMQLKRVVADSSCGRNNIFGLLNYLVPGITLAIFAAFYQNRRKREIQIEGNLAVSRIDSYEQVLSLLFEVQKLETPTLADEQVPVVS